MPYQTLLDNRTPFSAEKFVLPDKEGQEILLVVVVASFEARHPGGSLELAKEQSSVRVVDEYYGDPASSSIRYEGNLALEKPFVDVLLNAHAYAPGGKPVRRITVNVQVGDIRKSLLVQGNRRWVFGPFGKSPSRPEKFHKMPIIYERAFGGIDLRASNPKKRFAEPRNPIGVGLSHDPRIHTQVPNVEYPQHRMRARRDRPTPAGLGAVSRNCKPRLDFAGTYDDDWLNNHWPLLPMDFDPRHNQAAPADQQSQTLEGGEKVQLVNLTIEGRWQFKLPILDIPVHLLYDNRRSQTTLRMDTVLIEPDLYRMTMTSRLKMLFPRNQGVLREILLGHMHPGWIEARIAKEKYIDRLGTKGTDPNGQSFHL